MESDPTHDHHSSMPAILREVRELRAETAQIQTDIRGLRAEINELSSKFDNQISSNRDSTTSSDVKLPNSDIRSSVNAVQTAMSQMCLHMERAFINQTAAEKNKEASPISPAVKLESDTPEHETKQESVQIARNSFQIDRPEEENEIHESYKHSRRSSGDGSVAAQAKSTNQRLTKKAFLGLSLVRVHAGRKLWPQFVLSATRPEWYKFQITTTAMVDEAIDLTQYGQRAWAVTTPSITGKCTSFGVFSTLELAEARINQLKTNSEIQPQHPQIFQVWPVYIVDYRATRQSALLGY